MAGERKKKELHHVISPLHSQYEEELDRIRTEGDLTLIKVQTERQKLVELEAKLADANKRLRDRKKTPKQGEILAAKQQPPMILQEAGNNTTKRVQYTATTGKQLHTEERLKIALAERTTELQKLRHAIDEMRRKRLDALASEKEMLKEIQADEEDMKRAQDEVAQLKQHATDMKNEIAATELEFDTEKHAFRLERQRLLMEVEEIVKIEKQGTQDQPVPVSHKYSMFHNNVAHRRKQPVRTSKWKNVSLEQKIVSFEQKKRLLDRIVEETNVKNLSDFIQKYNDQERAKIEVFARIEEQTAANAALNESIAQLTEDITRLSGAGESSATDDTQQPSAELQKVLDADDAQIKRWMNDTDIFAEAVKCLRDPIHDIYKEFFPNDRSEDIFDSTVTRESGMMRRIGAIEERIMQFIMTKILEETETSTTQNNSDTLRRLRQYQGKQEPRNFTTPPLTQLYGVEPPSTLKNENSQRPKDGKVVPEDDDDIRDVNVMHSNVFRQKFIARSGADNTNTNTPNVSGSNGSPTRKNANVALHLS